MITDAFPPELAAFVQQELASGNYQSEEEMLCAGLRLLRERERRLQNLRDEILPALEQLDRGEGQELDIADIKARGRQRLATRGDTD
jgi:antitoxin ParD1/3/4